ncbi:WD40-repeat-containing domain protein [Halteromyces radiatus]|uniref:WD40-repeat-containing domain protein n=1 Tax=Halteromyces radiatus TaxID=101107 RepID=UPI00221F9050|nr:WD40-repeat-containing domain protein [Halteromyces radiatus]KAI8080088.1 WD40-repeat-containing domain protein [Halteromyces radiatus]
MTTPISTTIHFEDIRANIWQQLQQRDRQEQLFHSVISSNQRLQQQLNQLEKKAKLDNSSHITSSRHSLSSSNANVEILEQRIRELKEERADMYKLQSENAQRLVLMNDQLRNKEETDAKQKQELVLLADQTKKLTEKSNLQIEQLREKDVTIQILQDELSALQLEINTIEQRNQQLTKENLQLVQRWMEKMNSEADKMNEATQFYETALQQQLAQSRRKQQLSSSNKNSSSDQSLLLRTSTIVLPRQHYKSFTTTQEGDLYCIQASKTGKYFATGAEDRRIKLYDITKGMSSASTTTLSGALQSITSIDFNSSDDYLVASSTDHSTRVWNLSTKRIAHTLTGHIGKVFAAKFVPADNNRVVTGSHDRTLKVWDLNKGWCVRTIFSFSSCNDICLLDPDGQTVVSGHLDSTLRIWDAKSGNGIKDLNGIHTDQITSVCVSPDGSSVLTNSRDNTLKIVDVRMYEVVHSFSAPTYQNGLNWSRACFSPDGCYVAAGSKDGTVHIWNARNSQLERTLKGDHKSLICGVAWSPLGTDLYSADKTSKTVCIWDTSIEQRSLSSLSK